MSLLVQDGSSTPRRARAALQDRCPVWLRRRRSSTTPETLPATGRIPDRYADARRPIPPPALRAHRRYARMVEFPRCARDSTFSIPRLTRGRASRRRPQTTALRLKVILRHRHRADRTLDRWFRRAFRLAVSG